MCNCLNEMDEELRKQNARLIGFALLRPDFRPVAVIQTEWIDKKKVPKGQIKRTLPVIASHCPWCGEKYPEGRAITKND